MKVSDKTSAVKKFQQIRSGQGDLSKVDPALNIREDCSKNRGVFNFSFKRCYFIITHPAPSTSQNRHLRVIDRVAYCLVLEHLKKLLTFGIFSRQIKVIYQRSTSTTQLFTWVSYDRHRSQPVFHNSKAPMGTLKSIQRRMWHFSRIFWRHGQLNTI